MKKKSIMIIYERDGRFNKAIYDCRFKCQAVREFRKYHNKKYEILAVTRKECK